MKLLHPNILSRPLTANKLLSRPAPSRQRTFLPGLPSLAGLTPPLQHLNANRTLPHPSLPIYNIIAAVPSYSAFLPYCLSSTVTRWSRPDPVYHKRWPEEARLEIGWGAVREVFTSKIYCVPGRVVEAVGGGAATRLEAGEMGHHTHLEGETAGGGGAARGADDGMGGDGILTHLMTRWTVSPVAGSEESTDVNLDIEFQFANPVYAAMSSAVADRVAEVMIEAFEQRVKTELERKG
jgi:coenzyme Q-binding protein COQ10